jgi:hypothetical protein
MDLKNPLGERLEAAVNIVKKGFSACSNFDSIIDTALVHPLCDLSQHCHLTPGTPVEPMLDKPTKSVQKVAVSRDAQEDDTFVAATSVVPPAPSQQDATTFYAFAGEGKKTKKVSDDKR